MTKNSKKRLEKLGFVFNRDYESWGTMKAEPYDVGKNHFTARYRSVFVGKARDGYYVTSHIHGLMREYRCRTYFNASIANIFACDKLEQEAVTKFIHNFQQKRYNTSK